MKVELKLYQKESKRDQNGRYPVHLYVNDGRPNGVAYFGIRNLFKRNELDFRFTPKEFEEIRVRNIGKFNELRRVLNHFEDLIREEINNKKLRTKQEVRELVDSLALQDDLFNSTSSKSNSKTIADIFEMKISSLAAEGRSKDEYITCLKHFRRFLVSNKKLKSTYDQPISFFDELTVVALVSDFRGYLNSPTLGLSQNSVKSYLRQLRHIFTLAKIPYGTAFAGISTSTPSLKKVSLGPLLLKQLWDEDYSDDPMVEWSVNLALLTYFFGGANVLDLLNLKKENMEKIDKSNVLVQFVRSKTKRSSAKNIYCYLLVEKIERVLKYFGFNKRPDDYLFELTPPSSSVDFSSGKQNFNSSNLINDYAGKHLTKLFKRDRSKLDPEHKFQKVGLKLIRVSVMNILYSYNSENIERMRMATEALGDTMAMGRYYISMDSEVQAARKRAETLVGALFF
jgi:hypothetical protein